MAEMKMLARGTFFLLEALEQNCFQAHSNCWLNSVYAVVGLRCPHSLTGCFVSQGRSLFLEAAHIPLHTFFVAPSSKGGWGSAASLWFQPEKLLY